MVLRFVAITLTTCFLFCCKSDFYDRKIDSLYRQAIEKETNQKD